MKHINTSFINLTYHYGYEWLLKLLRGLERDGMIELERGVERSSQEKHVDSGMLSVRLSSKR